MTPTVSTVLLDVDGCLVDSRSPIRASFDIALDALGLGPLSDEELESLVGPPLGRTVPTLLARRGADPAGADAFIAAYRNDYRDRSVREAASYPGMPESLDALAAAGARLGVVTSKPLAFARPILDALGLTARFVHLEGPGLTEAEPKTVTLGRALAALGHPDPAQVAMVGDRHHDVDAGRALGTRTVGVTWGFGSRQELEAAGADEIVDHPTGLVSATQGRRAVR